MFLQGQRWGCTRSCGSYGGYVSLTQLMGEIVTTSQYRRALLIGSSCLIPLAEGKEKTSHGQFAPRAIGEIIRESNAHIQYSLWVSWLEMCPPKFIL